MRLSSHSVRIAVLVVGAVILGSVSLRGHEPSADKPHEPSADKPHEPSADKPHEPSADKPAEKQQSTLTWKAESSHPQFGTDVSQFYIRIRVAAPAAEVQRKPLHLALVLDRSASMQEEAKIGYLRKAAHLMIDNLTKRDRLALIAYNQEVQVLVPNHPVVNREYLHHRVDELYADGYTNLSGGLLEGCAQLDKHLDEPGIHHVILLTDGLANRGVTDPNGFVRMVEQCAGRGLTISAIGVGTEYNESLLGRIAQAGGGRYVYVQKPDQIPSAFEKELGALLSVVAQNARVRIELPKGIEPVKVFGRDLPLQPNKLELALGDLTSGEERTLLIKFRVDSSLPAGDSVELPLELTYDDIASAQRVKLKQSVSMEQATAGSNTDGGPSPLVAYARLVEGLDKMAVAVQGMDLRLASEVREIQRSEYPELREVARSSKDQDFVNKAFLFEHYARELQELIDRGELHEHSLGRAQLQKEVQYQRYLMEHHQYGHAH